MDMCLAEIIGRKATAATRPRMDALANWLAERSLVGDQVEACVFANVGAGQEAQLARWVANLRQWGWSVFVKPKQQRRDDIDDEMCRHIARRFNQGSLGELIVASHDAKAFEKSLLHLTEEGVAVHVLGYREREVLAAAHPQIGFIDLESVPGVFEEPLPRTNLFDLPPGGRWFDSFCAIEGTARVQPDGGEDIAPLLDHRVDLPQEEPPARSDVVAFVTTAVGDADEVGLSLQEAGELLRARFPGFSLHEAGYESVGDLLDELQASGEVLVTKSENGHVLRPLPSDPVAEHPDDAATEDPEIIDLERVEDAAGDEATTRRSPPSPASPVAAPRTVPATAEVSGANPIYRMFGFDPEATP